MSTVGSKITLALIEDGSQVHASLLSTIPISQAYTGGSSGTGACYPDWTVPENQPIIYLDIMKETTRIQVNDLRNLSWTYNGRSISNYVNTFQVSAVTVSDGSTCTALRIINNLATAQNVDEDLIALEGEVHVGTAWLPFRSTITASITSFAENGYYSQIYSLPTYKPTDTTFFNTYGVADPLIGFIFDNEQSQIVLYNELAQFTPKDGIAHIPYDTYRTKWFINGIEVRHGYYDRNYELEYQESGASSTWVKVPVENVGDPACVARVWVGDDETTGKPCIKGLTSPVNVPGQTPPAGTTGYWGFIIHKDSIVDYANIQCDCYDNALETGGYQFGNKIASDTQEIDDKTDDERTYIAAQVTDMATPLAYVDPVAGTITESGEGCDNTFRPTQQVNYKVWVATETNVASIKDEYKHWYIHFIKSNSKTYGEQEAERHPIGGISGATSPQDTTIVNTMLNVSSGSTLVGMKYYFKLTRDTQNGYGEFFLTGPDVSHMGRSMTGWLYGSTEPYEQ